MSKLDQNVGCLAGIFKQLGLLSASTSQSQRLPYVRKDFLLTKGERAFFDVLQNAVGGRMLIFSKVRIADLVFLPKGTEKRQTHLNRVQSKHVDFVLCDLKSIRPMLAIELDDASHDRADRVARDEFVDDVMTAAGLPMLHVKVRASYNATELWNEIVVKTSAPSTANK
jgi:very-short-patch-repair endonuclease